MKVNGPSPSAFTTGRSSAPPAADGFAPAEGGGSAAAAPTWPAANLAGVGSLEALLALQETPSPLERRRRAVRRSGRILDALEALRVSVLDPEILDASVLERLHAAVREARSQTDEPGLEGVLDEIELRAAVELAKREIRTAA